MVGLGGAVTGTPAADGRETKQALWDEFCQAHHIADAGVPLFSATPDGAVEVFAHGRDRRVMLRRSAAMEDLLIGTVEQVLAADAAAVEGVLYLMHRLDAAGRIVPLYVGKAGRYGRTGSMSANLVNIRGNGTMFSRWGYNYAYHMGDLSAAALPGHAPSRWCPSTSAGRRGFLKRRLRQHRACERRCASGAPVGDRIRQASGPSLAAARWRLPNTS